MMCGTGCLHLAVCSERAPARILDDRTWVFEYSLRELSILKTTPTAYFSKLVPRTGFEPVTLGLEVLCSIQLSYQGMMVRVGRIELPSQVWKTCILTVVLHPHNF